MENKLELSSRKYSFDLECFIDKIKQEHQELLNEIKLSSQMLESAFSGKVTRKSDIYYDLQGEMDNLEADFNQSLEKLSIDSKKLEAEEKEFEHLTALITEETSENQGETLSLAHFNEEKQDLISQIKILEKENEEEESILSELEKEIQALNLKEKEVIKSVAEQLNEKNKLESDYFKMTKVLDEKKEEIADLFIKFYNEKKQIG